MVMEVRLPQWGMGMHEGTVVSWLKSKGDTVAQGEPVVVIEAAKVTQEITAPCSGTIAEVLVSAGETVSVGRPLCIISASDGTKMNGAQYASPPKVMSERESIEYREEPLIKVKVTPLARKLAEEHGIDLDQMQESFSGSRITSEDIRKEISIRSIPRRTTRDVQVEPRARRLAKDRDLDLSNIEGTGPSGRITEKDVLRYLESPAVSRGDIIPLTGIRREIAKRMVESLRTKAQLTLMSEVDITGILSTRRRLYDHPDLTITDLVIKAVALSLKMHPRMNSRIEDELIVLIQAINIGIAVALDEGLVVPVLRDADQKSLREISSETKRLATLAREGRLTPEEVVGGTFTITNLGMYEIDAFTPIINPPESAILGVSQIKERAIRSGDNISWRQILPLCLTIDHRVVDGAQAAMFLKDIKEYLENPDLISNDI